MQRVFTHWWGETDLALDHLERGIDLGAMHKRWYESDSDFDSIRDEPRFQASLERI